jgi:arylsulfatase A-like enzyme
MNFVIIVLDTLRYDYLGCNGNPWIKTPNLDRFAAQAISFDRAYVGSFPTIPMRTDAFTGRFGQPLHPWAPLSWEAVTLPELMRNAGYVSMLVHDTPHLVNFGFGFDRPFHGWEMIRGQEVDRYRTDPVHREHLKFDPSEMRYADTFGAQAVRNMFDFAAEEDYCTARLFRTAAHWLERNRGHEKFFLWIDSFSPHEPWDRPKHYVELYDPGYVGEELTFPHYGSLAHLPTPQVRHIRALYAGLVTMVDRWVGYFLDHLDALGLAENTTVVVASDHGTRVGDRLLAGKARPHHEEIARILLVVRPPGGSEQRRFDELAQPADLMPTILELAKVAPPPEVRMQGISLVPLLNGEALHTRDVAVTASAVHPQRADAHAVITSQDWSLFDHPDPAARRLYELRDDPNQERNLITQRLGIADELHGAFLQFLAEHEASDELIAFWKNEPGADERLASSWRDHEPALRSYAQGQQRGLGLNPRSYVRTPDFGEGRP